MAKKQIIPQKYGVWVEVRRRYHRSDAQVQMARKLGLNPHNFGKLANEKQEPWKNPLPEFIEEIYFKRFGKRRPDVVRSIEQPVQDQREKKAERKARKDNPDLYSKTVENDLPPPFLAGPAWYCTDRQSWGSNQNVVTLCLPFR
ncbi:MAG: hypothetical protein ROW39_06135 [Anaerolineaceae bacterium]